MRNNRATAFPPRALGVLPLLFVALALTGYDSEARFDEALWMCNIANLVLAAGLIVQSYRMIWIATMWAVLGVPLWTWDAILHGRINYNSILTHFGAATLGIAILWRTGTIRRVVVPAIALGVTMQLLCRAITNPELNVNASHVPFHGVDGLFASYPIYWAANLMALSAGLVFIDYLIRTLVARPAGIVVPAQEAT